MAVDGARYTSPAALAAEKEALFRRQPLPLAFGCEIAGPGDYLTLDIAGVPVLLVRGDDGAVRGLLNTCRHRGARLLDGTGQVGKAFACPYHNWTYDRCGVLRAQPGAEHFPDIAVGEIGLMRFPAGGARRPRLAAARPRGLARPRRGPRPAGRGVRELRTRRLPPPRQPHLDQADELEAGRGYLPRILPRAHPAPRLDRQDAVRLGLPLRGLRPPCPPGGAPPQHRGPARRRSGDMAGAAARDHRLSPLPQCGAREPGPACRARALLSRPRAARQHGLPLQLRLARRRTARSATGRR